MSRTDFPVCRCRTDFPVCLSWKGKSGQTGMSVLPEMSTELDHARQIAERIARRMSADNGAKPNPAQSKPGVSSELAAVRAGISELQKQLAQLEAKVSFDSFDSTPHPATPAHAPVRSPVPITHSPWLAGINSSY